MARLQCLFARLHTCADPHPGEHVAASSGTCRATQHGIDITRAEAIAQSGGAGTNQAGESTCAECCSRLTEREVAGLLDCVGSLLTRRCEPFASAGADQCSAARVHSECLGAECCAFACSTSDHHRRHRLDDLASGVRRILQ